MKETSPLELHKCTKRNSYGIKRKVKLVLSLDRLIIKNSLSKFTLPMNMIESYEFKRSSPFWRMLYASFLLTFYYFAINDPEVRWFGYWSELSFFHKPIVLLWYALLPGMFIFTAFTFENRKIILTTRSGKRILIFSQDDKRDQDIFFGVLDEFLVLQKNSNKNSFDQI